MFCKYPLVHPTHPPDGHTPSLYCSTLVGDSRDSSSNLMVWCCSRVHWSRICGELEGQLWCLETVKGREPLTQHVLLFALSFSSSSLKILWKYSSFFLFPLHPSDDSGKCLLTSPSAVRAGSPRANSSSTTNQRQLRRIWTPYYGGNGG